jgi:hypothetical protein
MWYCLRYTEKCFIWPLTGYFSDYIDWRSMWPSYRMFPTVYRIMILVAILRDMFLAFYSSTIKVNTMNKSFSIDASPEPEGISLWTARVLCFEHMNPVYILTAFFFNIYFLRLLYKLLRLFHRNIPIIYLIIKNYKLCICILLTEKYPLDYGVMQTVSQCRQLC